MGGFSFGHRTGRYLINQSAQIFVQGCVWISRLLLNGKWLRGIINMVAGRFSPAWEEVAA